AGALLGAVAGGAAGNAIGGGSGRAAATALGIFGGAILGNHIEGRGESRTRTVQECSTQNTYENRTVAYNVVYEYAGREYSMQMDRAPGRYVPLSVQPVGVASVQPAQGYYQPQPERDIVRIGGQRPGGYYRDDDRRYQDGGRRYRDENQWDRNWR
ncbi:glycine zipper 2TM domain-containing protein, partial [Hydrogenophaga sp.]